MWSSPPTAPSPSTRICCASLARPRAPGGRTARLPLGDAMTSHWRWITGGAVLALAILTVAYLPGHGDWLQAASGAPAASRSAGGGRGPAGTALTKPPHGPAAVAAAAPPP